jgi:spermidine/putrescine ABC transporter ATP-binding subunit
MATSSQGLEIVEVTKKFGSLAAVNNVSLNCAKQSFLTILGPSGCGKTTLLRCIAGLAEPDSGKIYLNGRDITEVSIEKRNIALVPQAYGLFPHMTVAKNVGFGLRMRKVSKDKISKRVKEVLETVRLGGLEARYPKQLSGGQQQRVALARALAIDPDLILLDEPLSNLDLRLRIEMQVELKKIQNETKVTSVYVTHDQGEALTLSDQIAVMKEGRIAEIGSPREIYDKPQTKFVAGFIGEANLFDAEVSGIDETHTFLTTVEGVKIKSPAYPGVKTGQKVGLVLRPEVIKMGDGRVAGDNSCEGTILDLSYKGSFIRYRIDIGCRLVTIDSEAKGTVLLQPGRKVLLHWKIEDNHIVQN